MPNNIPQPKPPPKAPAAPSSQDFLPLTEFWQMKARRDGNPQFCRDPREVALEEAAKIIAEAGEEAERLKKEAQEKGFSDGEQEGKAEGLKQYEDRLRRFDSILQALHEQRREIGNKYEEELLPLIKAMVERLVNHEVSVNPRVISACFQKAMEFVVENSEVQVHLHTEDFNRIKEASLENPALLSGKGRVQLVDDPNISQGGCLLKTDFGEVDSTLEKCRAKLYEGVDQAFLAALAEDRDQVG